VPDSARRISDGGEGHVMLDQARKLKLYWPGRHPGHALNGTFAAR
jgi:hypothetical protein